MSDDATRSRVCAKHDTMPQEGYIPLCACWDSSHCARYGNTTPDRAATVAEYVIGQVRAIIAVYDAGGADADSALDRIEKVIDGV